MVHRRTFLEQWEYSTALLDDEAVLGNAIFLIFGVTVCTCAFAGQRSLSLLLIDLNFETGFLTEPGDWLGCLHSQARGTDPHHHTGLFHPCWGSNCGPHASTANTFPSEPAPSLSFTFNFQESSKISRKDFMCTFVQID